MKIRAKDVTTIDELQRSRDDLFEALSRESDRGLVLVSASCLDHSLERLLVARFTMRQAKPRRLVAKLFESFGPLHSFAAKTSIAFGIDLIGEWMHRDLIAIRKLRNELAHGIGAVRFDSPDVVKFTQGLEGANRGTALMARPAAKQKEQQGSSGIGTDATNISKLDSDDTKRITRRIELLNFPILSEDVKCEGRQVHEGNESQRGDGPETETSALERARLEKTVIYIFALLSASIVVLSSDGSTEMRESRAAAICQ